MSVAHPKPKRAVASKQPVLKSPRPLSVAGRIPDEVFALVSHQLRTMTTAQARRHMIKVGILDQAGNRIGPVE